jgi:transcriptional regulator with XRE-family HTH domain
MELISKKIRISRLEKTYKQEYMAEEMGISQSAYSKIERGETDITVSQLRKIATILGLTLLDLIEK